MSLNGKTGSATCRLSKLSVIGFCHRFPAVNYFFGLRMDDFARKDASGIGLAIAWDASILLSGLCVFAA